MDWRDYFRGLFGRSQQAPPRHEQDQQWPPPPPIPGFNHNDDGSQGEESGESADTFNGPRNRFRRGVPFSGNGGWGQPDQHNGVEGGFPEFGNSFVFGDLFSAMGEMFQEMERSMRDVDRFFHNQIEDRDDGTFSFPRQLLPPPSQNMPESKGGSMSEGSIRDSVLKEPDSPRHRGNTKHYIPQPESSTDKVDRNLDELYNNSLLDLSELPLPNKNAESANQLNSSLVTPPDSSTRVASSFQRTFQTFSFRNGRWEGEIVKEDANGKHVTKYYQDETGNRHETTQFFPRGDQSQAQRPLKDEVSQDHSHQQPIQPYDSRRLFQFFDRFFRPRM